jgi:hypothetical protein
MFLVAIAVILAHSSSLAGGFVWDDRYNVVENEDIQSLTNIPGFFTEAWGASAPEGSRAREKNRGLYRPLTLVSYTIDRTIFGLTPWAFHLSNLLIHLICGLFVLLLARRFCGPGAGLILALFWAVHPVHTEAISVISYRTTLLAGLFGFASLYVQTHQDNVVRRVLVRTILFALACFAKEDGVVFAAILPLHDLLIRRIPFRKAAIYALPLLGFALVFFSIRTQILDALPYSFYAGVDANQQLAGVMQSTWLYAHLVVIPYPLTPFYDWSIFPIPETWLHLQVLAGLTISLGILWCGVRFKPNPQRSFLALALLVTLLPYSHILPFAVGAAERFIYVPTFFAFALVVQSFRGLNITSINSARLSKYISLILTLWLIPMIAWSAMRHRDWQSQLHITQATTEDYPHSFNAWIAYADELDLQSRKEEAADAYGKARGCTALPVATIREVEVRMELNQKPLALAVIRDYLNTYGPQIERLSTKPRLGHLQKEIDHLKDLKNRLENN